MGANAFQWVKTRAKHEQILTMASTKLYLDRRSSRADGTFPLKIRITRNQVGALINLGIRLLPDQWDEVNNKVINHPQKRYLNGVIVARHAEIEKTILRLYDSGEIGKMTAQDIKRHIIASQSPEDIPPKSTFVKTFQSFIGNKTNKGTKGIYKHTLDKIQAFDPDINEKGFEDIDLKWLTEFEAFCAKTASKNARNIHLRNIRAVFNYAINAEETTCYPFRKFKIRPEATRKRSLSVDALRQLFDYPVESYAEIYRDMFKLIFMLIGINTVDLHWLKAITPDGRIEYKRAKTHRLYSIKVEPEAVEIINKYKGKNGLLCIADRWSNHINFRHQMNKALQNIGTTRSGLGGKKSAEGAFPGLSTYWARHSWATIAASLDIPKETIAAALGHGGNTVTDIYIDFDQRKVDEANRRVLDWVLYGKK